MPKFCSTCGNPAQTGERYCGSCGTALAAPAGPPPALGGPPPDGGLGAAPADAQPDLPPSPGLWNWQPGVIGIGEKAAAALNLNRPGAQAGMFGRMVRGAFLDARVYREAAMDRRGSAAAAVALGLTFLSAVLGSYLLGFSLPRLSSIGFIAASLVLQALALAAAFGIMAVLSEPILGRKLDFGSIFRGMAYAQSPGILSIVPVLGQLVNLWRLPASLAALREVGGATTGRTVLLLIAGAAAATSTAFVLAPLLFSLLG